jgi:predicted ester cyclase
VKRRSFVLAAPAFALGARFPVLAAADGDGVKALVKRYVEILNSGDTSKLDEIVAEIVVTQGDDVQGLSEIKQRLVEQRAARESNFPEWRFELTRLIAEGDTAAFELLFVATTHSGKGVSTPVTAFVKAKDGKLVEIESVVDTEGLREQMSFESPTPAPNTTT